MEIVATLRQLQQNHDPLLIKFKDRNLRFQSFLVEVDRERNRIALDEIIPTDGERFLKQGEAFTIEAYRDGVRVAWECEHSTQPGEFDGMPCYWAPMPLEVTYHQRRSAYRAPLKQTDLVKIVLAGDKLRDALSGHLLDISATGCKLRLSGNYTESLQPGQVYERLTAHLPVGTLNTAVELRHAHYDEKIDMTFLGTRFYIMGGQEQRLVERFVYQLQREARRTESDGPF